MSTLDILLGLALSLPVLLLISLSIGFLVPILSSDYHFIQRRAAWVFSRLIGLFLLAAVLPALSLLSFLWFFVSCYGSQGQCSAGFASFMIYGVPFILIGMLGYISWKAWTLRDNIFKKLDNIKTNITRFSAFLFLFSISLIAWIFLTRVFEYL